MSSVSSADRRKPGLPAVRAASSRPRSAGPEFVWAGTCQAPAGHDTGPQRHPLWKLTLYRSGSVDTAVGERRRRVARGTVLAVPPSVEHWERGAGEYSSVYLLVKAPDGWPWPAMVQDADGTLGMCFRGLYGEHRSPDRFSTTMIPMLLTQLDVHLRRAAAPEVVSPAHRLVRAVDRIFTERYHEPLRIDRVADEVEVSESTLRAAFRSELGVSPRERLRQIRLDQAILLLRASNRTVEAVAVECGYYSASHLTRHLKRARGLAPGELRTGGAALP
jgi:AraC-like DNA-binding protein